MFGGNLPGFVEQQGSKELAKKVTLNNSVTGQHIVLGDSVINGAVGFSTWFKLNTALNSSVGTNHALFGRNTSSNNNEIVTWIEQGTGKIKFLVRNGSTTYSIVSDSSEWKSDEWYWLLCMIHPTDGLVMYVNGVKQTNTDNTFTSAFPTTSDNFYLGSFSANVWDFPGDIKLPKIYSSELTQEEVISEMTYKPTGLESYIKEFWDFENYSSGTSDGVNGTTATFTNPLGSTDDLIADTPITDYYGINFNPVNDEYINLGNTVINNTRGVLVKFILNEDVNPGTGSFYNPIMSRVNLDATRDHDFSIQFNNGKMFFERRDGAGTLNSITSDSSSWSKDTEYYVVFQIDNATGMESWIGGVKQTDTDASTIPIGTEGNDFCLGAILRDSRRFNGVITKFAILNDVLTPTEITEYDTKIFDGTEVKISNYFQQLQGEGAKIYDFKTDEEGILNSSSSTDRMWVLNTPDIISNNLVMYLDATNTSSYPGTGTLWSDLINSNDGTLTNGATYSADGGGSISLDGVNDFVIVPDNIDLRPEAGDYTICFWIKYEGVPLTSSSILSPVFGKGQYTTNGNEFEFLFRGGTWNGFYSRERDGGSGAIDITPDNNYATLINQGDFIFCAITKETGAAQEGKVYVNGGKAGSTASLPVNINNTASLYLGRYASSYGEIKISKFMMYKGKALNAYEILQNYNNSKNSYN